MKTGTYPRIRSMKLSPDINPLVEPEAIAIKRRHVRTGTKKDLLDAVTGEISATSIIHTIENKDDAEFVKVFAAGVAASYDLTKTGQRVFHIVLLEYQKTPMSHGFADSVELYWFNDGLAGHDIGLSAATFNRGMRELIAKLFIYPRSPGSYWVNPSLFFKGNRVLFVQEFVRKRSVKEIKHQPKELAE